jgi:hypothetical protein
MRRDAHRCGVLAFVSFATAAVLPGAAAASAEARSMFKPPFDFSIRESREPPAPGGPLPYTATAPNAAWSVIAWDIPGGDLTPFQRSKSGADTVFVSRAAEAGVKVTQQPDGQARYSFSQDGAALPCNTADGKPRESDLFAHPNTAQNQFETNAYLAKIGSVKIDDLASLISVATLSYSAALSVPHKECPVAQGAAVIALILRDFSDRQTLFYQVELSQACGLQPNPRAARCKRLSKAPRPNFFARRTPFGIDDPLPLHGQPFLTDGETRKLSIDLLPGVKAAIATGPQGMSRDPSHWTVTGYFNGQIIFGGLRLETTWANVSLIAVDKTQTSRPAGHSPPAL